MSNSTINNKRLKSTKGYIDDLQEQYSKLNVIRLDLGYKKQDDPITLEDANKDINRLLNNRRGKPAVFDNQVGYVIKKEFTQDKGVHLHTLFLYDGQKIKSDTIKADQIGKYWEDEITKGKGSYHNCHRNKYDKSGIGMLDYTDSEKRQILDENVISYLCKDEQEIDPLKATNREKSFTRGIVTKSKGNMGRPRKKSVEE